MEKNTLDLFPYIIYFTGIIILISPVFQALKILKTKNAKNVSLLTWIGFLLCGLGTLAYDLYTYSLTGGISSNLRGTWPICIFILENAVTIYLIFRYKKPD